MKILRIAFFAASLWLAACTAGRGDATALIPLPAEVVPGRGAFDLTDGVTVGVSDSLLLPAAEYLARALADIGVRVEAEGRENLTLSLDPALGAQDYRLSITSGGIALKGGSYEAVVSGAATLQQLLWTDLQRLRAVEIADTPRFAWRGVMLDVSRHFFTTEEVKSLLDRMALYKFNRLHLHLTDDQGWRVEIRRYPRLTEQGAWRLPNKHDSLCMARAEADRDDKFRLPQDRMRDGFYGGYYTQDQIRDLVAYAAQRGIEVVPEIDLPGHSLAALGVFPELSCDGRGGAWGVNFTTPLCLGNDRTLTFCRNVLEEIFELFPSRYVHVGGDEVERTAWEHCPKCRARVEVQGLDGIEGLQPWFTRELERFCRERGKTLVGWDEVADDGLSAESVVMWWRSWSPGTLNDAVQAGHSVIISPSEYYYLDEKQDRNSLAKVYGYEPVPSCLPEREGLNMGIQGHLWSEVAPSKEAVGERLFPRLLAIAETAWSRPEAKDFADFERRLPLHLRELDRSGWNYRMDDVGGICDRNVYVGSKVVALKVPEGATLCYTLDGSVPDTTSLRYEKPFTVAHDCELRMRCYNARGVASESRSAVFESTDCLPAMEDSGTLSEGLLVRWFDFEGECCARIDKAPLKDNFISMQIGIPEDVVGNIGLVFDGYIEVPQDGIYSFYTYSDDGSMLEIDCRTVVDNDGLHPRTERSGQAALRRGLHKFSLRYFDSNGGILEAGMIDSDGVRHPFAAGMFKH